MTKPCCYFYIDPNGIIAYVGKANGTLDARVKAHAKEQKFMDCRCKFDIRYETFEKQSDMDMAEKVYIKALKPYLNVVDTTTGFFPLLDFKVEKLAKYDPNAKEDKKDLNSEELKKKKEYEKRARTRILHRDLDLNDPRYPLLESVRVFSNFFYAVKHERRKRRSFAIYRALFGSMPGLMGHLCRLLKEYNFADIKKNGDYVIFTVTGDVDKALGYLCSLEDYIKLNPIENLDNSSTHWVERQYHEFMLQYWDSQNGVIRISSATNF